MNELAPRPSQPCQPIPNGLVSLWDMLELRAIDFIGALQSLRNIEMLVEQNVGNSADVIDAVSAGKAYDRLTEVERTCDEIGAAISADFARDGVEVLQQGNMNWTMLAAASKQIHIVLEKELRRARLFSMAPNKIAYFERSLDRFDTDVLLGFSSALDDIDEAGKCFAMGRYTACVFHLMRVLERPINSLAKVLLPDDPLPNWGTVLKKIDTELARPPKERTFQGDVQFFSEVAAEMRSVQHAWRNRVMHIDQLITEERARSIFEATIGFMNAVSTKMDEDGLMGQNFELDLETPSQP